MTDFSAIRVLNFSGRKEDWPSWNEKFLAKAKRSGIKDILLGKVEIPTSLDVINEKTEEGKKLLRIAALAWEKLKKRYDPISALLLVKTERMKIRSYG
jgi:hypothetical protein